MLISDLVEEFEASLIDLGVSEVDPDLVEELEAELRVASLVLQQLAKVRLLGHTVVMGLQSLD